MIVIYSVVVRAVCFFLQDSEKVLAKSLRI